MLAKKQYSIFLAAILGLLILNFIALQSPILGSSALVVFLVLASFAFGNPINLFPKLVYPEHCRRKWSKFLLRMGWPSTSSGNKTTELRTSYLSGFLIVLSLIIATSSVAYLIFGLTTITLLAILVLIGGTSCIIYQPASGKVLDKLEQYVLRASKTSREVYSLLLVLLVWALAIAGFALLYTSQTSESIVSPWVVVPKSFFVLFFLLALSTLVFVKNGARVGPLILPLFLLAISVVVVIYRIGYGFDQFVHEAALRYIGEHGIITPRTPYYIGEYGLLAFISKFAFIPLGTLNRFLLPALFGTLIPLVISRLCVPEGRTLRPSLMLLLFPLTPFIATTPQGLAYLFLILLILVGWIYLKGAVTFSLPALLALATLCIHIIAGIPAVIFLAFIYLAKNKALTVRAWVFLFAIGSLAIPALFAILSFVQPSLVQLGLHGNLLEFLGNLFDLRGRYNFWLDIVYLNILLIPAFLFILIPLGLRKIKEEHTRAVLVYKDGPCMTVPYLALFGILLVDFLITFLFFSFPSLIRYEQSDFALRFFEMSFYFLIPLILCGGVQFFARLQNLDRLTRGIMVAILAIFITSSVYLSYPRKDAYDVSHGFSTSSHDIAAVRAIEKDAAGTSYIVLANQAVGAAALHEFGFSRAYLKTVRGEVYFYSIPTGGELYRYYLRMVYDAPRAEIAREAAEFAGVDSVDSVYLVINDYWWNAKKLIEIAKQEAKDSKEIADGKVWVFRY